MFRTLIVWFKACIGYLYIGGLNVQRCLYTFLNFQLWRVGDGLSIRVYKDNWIPGVFPTKAVLPWAGFSKDLRVAELINPDTGWWDIQKIEQMFLPFEVQKIKEVPLCVTRQEDCLIWLRSRDGKYSVKTGYQLLLELDRKNRASSSDVNPPKNFWNRLWRIGVPNKVKVFLWWACSEALPTRKYLLRRKVLNDPTCSFCSIHQEDMVHALCDSGSSRHLGTTPWLGSNRPPLVTFSCWTSILDWSATTPTWAFRYGCLVNVP